MVNNLGTPCCCRACVGVCGSGDAGSFPVRCYFNSDPQVKTHATPRSFGSLFKNFGPSEVHTTFEKAATFSGVLLCFDALSHGVSAVKAFGAIVKGRLELEPLIM